MVSTVSLHDIQRCHHILTTGRSLFEYSHQIRVEKFKHGRVLSEAESPHIVGIPVVTLHIRNCARAVGSDTRDSL